MKTTMTYLIQQQDIQKTVEQFLLSNGYSAALIRRLRHTEQSILKNGSPVYTTYRLDEGDSLTVTLPGKKELRSCGARSHGPGHPVRGP